MESLRSLFYWLSSSIIFERVWISSLRILRDSYESFSFCSYVLAEISS